MSKTANRSDTRTLYPKGPISRLLSALFPYHTGDIPWKIIAHQMDITTNGGRNG
jgi:hypothetical protein